ncbi:hypothetical protein [[Flexibacter] sp. ATCC 35103]|nr:hypothetical protein [[Flexibacter] sp. ATCC 35103]
MTDIARRFSENPAFMQTHLGTNNNEPEAIKAVVDELIISQI